MRSIFFLLCFTPCLAFAQSAAVPQCQEAAVKNVLSDAFQQQGINTHTPMTVKALSQIQETGFYPQKGIRSCKAIVDTNGSRYFTDYSIILNDKGFFVQVENAQAYQGL